MPTHYVNLDALIPREDFEVLGDAQPPAGLATHIKASELERSSFTYQVLKKPDFQRETASWEPEKIAEFVFSFLNGDLIPSLILWRSPQSGNIFVIDGAHRLSALIAWIQNDYGDGEISRRFFANLVPQEQLKVADQTRDLLGRTIGSYAELKTALAEPAHSRPERVKWARNMSSFAISLQWVTGDAKSAESSFFKINQKATPIDATELRMIKARRKPNAMAARALIRAGVGHKYWSEFREEFQGETERIAKEIYEVLFEPALETPIKTLDLPVAGRGYSADSVRLLFDFVNLVNDVRTDKSQTDLLEDPTGETTVRFLRKVRRVAQRITGKHASSLGLHPAVYFYGATGRYQPTAFLAAVSLVEKLEKEHGFARFTALRSRFEDFLLGNRDFTNQLVRRYGSGLKGSGRIFELYEFILGQLAEDLQDEAILQATLDKFGLGKEATASTRNLRRHFTTEVKSAAFLRDAIARSPLCAICGARLHVKSISIDHATRKADGGLGILENAQLAHPYCNTGFKEGVVSMVRAHGTPELELPF